MHRRYGSAPRGICGATLALVLFVASTASELSAQPESGDAGVPGTSSADPSAPDGGDLRQRPDPARREGDAFDPLRGFGAQGGVPTPREGRWPTPVPLAPRDEPDIDTELDREEAVRLREDSDDLRGARDRLIKQRGRGPRRTAKDRDLERRIEALEEEIREQDERALQLDGRPRDSDDPDAPGAAPGLGDDLDLDDQTADDGDDLGDDGEDLE